MKLDLKEWINKVNSLGKYGTQTVISDFPFTATKDGMVIVVCSVPSASSSYFYINEDGLAHARGCSTGGLAYSVCFPVIKGRSYTISARSNSNPYIKFYPFMGGVVRKLLKALKPLTLGRGWAV